MSSDLISALSAAASGMRAQTTRIRLAAENVANANTTSQTPGGDPYQRRMPVFKEVLNRENGALGVKIATTVDDQTAFPVKYDPSNPGANADGFVKLSNVQTLVEMADIREAQRSYEANLTIVESSRSMINRALDLLRR